MSEETERIACSKAWIKRKYEFESKWKWNWKVEEAQVEGLVRTMKSCEQGISGTCLIPQCLFNVFIDDLELRDKTQENNTPSMMS